MLDGLRSTTSHALQTLVGSAFAVNMAHGWSGYPIISYPAITAQGILPGTRIRRKTRTVCSGDHCTPHPRLRDLIGCSGSQLWRACTNNERCRHRTPYRAALGGTSVIVDTSSCDPLRPVTSTPIPLSICVGRGWLDFANTAANKGPTGPAGSHSASMYPRSPRKF